MILSEWIKVNTEKYPLIKKMKNVNNQQTSTVTEWSQTADNNSSQTKNVNVNDQLNSLGDALTKITTEDRAIV